LIMDVEKQNRTVLVVDDEPSVLFTYKLLVEREGYKAIAVETSKKAMDVLHSAQRLDLLLCDLSLEEKHNGFEVIEFALSRFKQLPCVLLSGYATNHIVERAKGLNVPVLHKPIDIEEFLKTVTTILGADDGDKAQTKEH